jgi:hypothetical protein
MYKNFVYCRFKAAKVSRLKPFKYVTALLRPIKERKTGQGMWNVQKRDGENYGSNIRIALLYSKASK